MTYISVMPKQPAPVQISDLETAIWQIIVIGTNIRRSESDRNEHILAQPAYEIIPKAKDQYYSLPENHRIRLRFKSDEFELACNAISGYR